jgi:hypothetical protein
MLLTDCFHKKLQRSNEIVSYYGVKLYKVLYT